MKNLLTTVCKCGHVMNENDIKPPFENVPRGFYGGNVSRFSDAVCECGIAYKLYIRPTRQSWKVVDMEPVVTDYQSLTNAELVEMARSMGHEISGRLNKTQLIALITAK